MTTLQAMCLGAMLAWTPSLVVLAWLLREAPLDELQHGPSYSIDPVIANTIAMIRTTINFITGGRCSISGKADFLITQARRGRWPQPF
jgi:hypothetical protein